MWLSVTEGVYKGVSFLAWIPRGSNRKEERETVTGRVNVPIDCCLIRYYFPEEAYCVDWSDGPGVSDGCGGNGHVV